MGDLQTLKDLFASQRVGVLARQREGEPFGCLVAFAAAEDLKCLLFATGRSTQKYLDIAQSPRVSMLIDSRSNQPADFEQAIAVTARGSAHEVTNSERDRLEAIYLAKHPYLTDFIHSRDTVLLRMDVDEYVIASFKEVKTLRPY